MPGPDDRNAPSRRNKVLIAALLIAVGGLLAILTLSNPGARSGEVDSAESSPDAAVEISSDKGVEKISARSSHTRSALASDATKDAPRSELASLGPARIVGRIVGRIGFPAGLAPPHPRVSLRFVRADPQGKLIGSLGLPAVLTHAGSFKLEVQTATSGWFVASAENFRPLSYFLELEAGETVDLGFLPFEPGATIEGLALFMGRSFSAGGRISAIRQKWNLSINPRQFRSLLRFDDGEFEPLFHETSTDDSGHFALRGLRPGRYYLTLSPPALYSKGQVIVTSTHEFGVEVSAPASGIVLDSPHRKFRIEVICDGRPLSQVILRAECRNSWTPMTRGDSPLSLIVIPETVKSLVLAKPGYREVTRNFDPRDFDASGTMTVEMIRIDELADLEVHLTGSAAGLNCRAWMKLAADGAPRGWKFDREIEITAGVLRVAEVPYDRISLSVGPLIDESLPPNRQNLLVPFDAYFRLRPETGDRIDQPAMIGGRVALSLSGLSSSAETARLILRDAEGRVHSTSLLRDGGPGEPATVRVWEIASDRPHLLHPPLPEGSYKLRVDFEGVRYRVDEVEVREGQVTPVEIAVGS